jgi:hypothetical protein
VVDQWLVGSMPIWDKQLDNAFFAVDANGTLYVAVCSNFKVHLMIAKEKKGLEPNLVLYTDVSQILIRWNLHDNSFDSVSAYRLIGCNYSFMLYYA